MICFQKISFFLKNEILQVSLLLEQKIFVWYFLAHLDLREQEKLER